MTAFPIFPLNPDNSTFAATTTSGTTPIVMGGSGGMVMVQNVSAAEAFVNVGDVDVEAIAGGAVSAVNDGSFSVPGNSYRVLSIPNTATHFVAITAASTATLRVTRGSFAG